MEPYDRPASEYFDRSLEDPEVIEAEFAEIGMKLERRISPLRTWLPKIDESILGFTPGKLYVCGGRPGTGKTSFGTTVTANILRESPEAVLFISTELTAGEIRRQVAEAYCGGFATAPKDGMMTKHEMGVVRGAKESVMKAQDEHRLSIMVAKRLTERLITDAIRHHCHVLNDERTSLVIVDQANRIHREDKERHGYAVATEHLLNSLEIIAEQEVVPVLLMTQLGRGVEHQKLPTMSNLKHSGGLEEFAHCVILLHNDPISNSSEGQKIIIAKNRDGGPAITDARFYGEAHTWDEA